MKPKNRLGIRSLLSPDLQPPTVSHLSVVSSRSEHLTNIRCSLQREPASQLLSLCMTEMSRGKYMCLSPNFHNCKTGFSCLINQETKLRKDEKSRVSRESDLVQLRSMTQEVDTNKSQMSSGEVASNITHLNPIRQLSFDF